MTRLNVQMRAKMTEKALVVAGTAADLAKLVERRKDLAEAIRRHALGGTDGIAAIEKAAKSIKDKMAGNLFDNVSGFRVKMAAKNYELYKINLGGMRVTLQFNGLVSEYDAGAEKVHRTPVPISVTHPADSEFTKEFLAIEADYKALLGKRDGLRLQVRAALDPFTTVKKLLEAWPEAAELLPDDIDEAKPPLPVILTKDLNCLLGLPS